MELYVNETRPTYKGSGVVSTFSAAETHEPCSGRQITRTETYHIENLPTSQSQKPSYQGSTRGQYRAPRGLRTNRSAGAESLQGHSRRLSRYVWELFGQAPGLRWSSISGCLPDRLYRSPSVNVNQHAIFKTTYSRENFTNRLHVRNIARSSIKAENPAQVPGKRDEVCGDPVKKRGFVGMTGRGKRRRNRVR